MVETHPKTKTAEKIKQNKTENFFLIIIPPLLYFYFSVKEKSALLLFL